MQLITGIFNSGRSGSAISQAAQDQIRAALAAAGVIQNTTTDVNNQLVGTTNDANAASQFAYESGTAGVNTATQTANDAVLAAQKQAASGVNTATQTANGYLNPYMTAGADATVKLSDLASGSFDFSNWKDPGYDFRMQQGQKALERSAAAKGSALGGAAGMALERYGQEYGSGEYSKAFDRFRADRADRTSTLSQLASFGLNAGTRAGANTIGAATYEGDTGMAANQWTGTNTMLAADFAARAGMDTYNRMGDRNITTGRINQANSLSAADFVAKMNLGIGDIQAGSTLGRANVKNQMWSAIGKTVDAAVAGGMGGGGGFDWGAAFRGALGASPRPRGSGGSGGGSSYSMPGGQY